jgi:hypothetical protein
MRFSATLIEASWSPSAYVSKRNVVVDEDVNLLFPLPVREPWSRSIAALIAQCTWAFAARQLLSPTQVDWI